MRLNKRPFYAAFLVFTGLIIGLIIASSLDINSKSIAQPREVSSESKDFLEKFSIALAEVSEAAKPSVVNISTSKTVHGKDNQYGHFFNDPFFKRFFGEENPFHIPKKFKTRSLGSGVVVSDDGYILTNSHVVKGADEIRVIMNNKKQFEGKVIGADPKTDLAVIKIEAEDLPVIKIGNSETLQVGEVILAIGNPYGLNQTVTMGIVSAVGRSDVGIADYEDFIQTDAAINPGNSGGAMVNSKGELVGINTAIFSTSGGYQGIGFAIPSRMAKSVLDHLINKGKVVRGWLGVHIQDLTPEIAKYFKTDVAKGVLVADVVDDSPADKSGLLRGDLIAEYDGREVENTRQLRNMVANTMPGSSVEVLIVRDEKKMTLSIKIGELSETLQVSVGEYENNLKGVDVQDLTKELIQRLEIPPKVSGVIVTNVHVESPAHGILRQRDIIQEINRKKIRNVSDFEGVASGIKKGDDVLLLIYRGGSYLYITISG